MILEFGKKAVSQVIAVVLLILLVIGATSVVSIFVIKMVEDPLLSPSNCLDYQIKPPISIDKVRYDSGEEKLQVTLKRLGDDLDIGSLDFVIKSGSGSSSWCCGEECSNCVILEQGTKDYLFPGIENPEEVSLVVGDCFVEMSDRIEWS